MISVDLKSKSFGSAQILGEIKLSVAAGECVALLGPSGIGKTTLLRIVSGLDSDFDGHLTKPNRIAMVFQEPTLLNWRSVLQNLTLVTGISPDAAMLALTEVGLAGKEDLYPLQLSLGQRRRLSLARAFVTDPDFLVLDEPFASLDPEKLDEMISLTKSLLAKRDIAALLVTHSKEEAKALGTRTLHLNGSPATLS